MYSVCDCVCIDNEIFVSLWVYASLLNEHVCACCILCLVPKKTYTVQRTVYGDYKNNTTMSKCLCMSALPLFCTCV